MTRRGFGAGLLSLALGLLLAAGRARAQTEAEPPLPGARSLYLLDVPFLHFGPLDVAPASPGRFALSLTAAYANTFSHTWHPQAIQHEYGVGRMPFTLEEAEELHRRHSGDNIAFIDGELTRVSLTASLGLTRELSASVEVPWISWGAVHADGLLESFHSQVGLSDSQRTSFPRGRFEVVLQRPEGPLEFDDRQPSAGLGDITAGLKWRHAAADGTHLLADVVVKFPTGDAENWRGSGSVDAGLLLGVSRRFGAESRFGARLEGGVVHPGSWRGRGIFSFRVAPFLRLLLAGDLRLGRATYVSLSALLEQSPLRWDSRGDAGRTGVEATVGLARRLGEGAWAELALVENVPRYGDAADLALVLRLRAAP